MVPVLLVIEIIYVRRLAPVFLDVLVLLRFADQAGAVIDRIIVLQIAVVELLLIVPVVKSVTRKVINASLRIN